MDETAVSDEKLAALADGELAADEATRLRARIDRDPALAERFALFAETRALLAPDPADEDAAGLDDAGRDRLAAAIRTADGRGRAGPTLSVVEGGRTEPPAHAPARRPAARAFLSTPALAASLALVLGGALGFAVGRGGAPGGSSSGDVVAALSAPAGVQAISSALERTPSGEAASWSDEAGTKGSVLLIATHAVGAGVCREYEASVAGRPGAAVGLGCRQPDGGWRTEIVARKAQQGDAYAAASGASVVEGALEAMGSSGPLSAAEEKARIAGRWAPGT